MIRHPTAALATLLAFTLPGLAADLAPVPVEPAAPVYLPFSWTGFYAGLNGGYGLGNDDEATLGRTPRDTIGSFGGLDTNGFFGGAQIGAAYQLDSFVFGIESDIQKAWMDDSVGPKFVSALSPEGIDAVASSLDVDWFGTVRGRAGVALDRTLLYGTGGVAFGSIDYNANLLFDGGDTAHLTTDSTEVGWVAGAGVEHAFTDNWTVKVEYEYIDLGEVTAKGPIVDGGGDAVGTARSSRDVNFHTVRAGVNYKF